MTREERMMRLLLETRLFLGTIHSWYVERVQEGRAQQYIVQRMEERLERFDKEMKVIEKPPVAYIGR